MSDKGLTAVTYVAASGGLILGMSAAEFAAYASIALGALTYITNVAFKIYDRGVAKKACPIVDDRQPDSAAARRKCPGVVDD